MMLMVERSRWPRVVFYSHTNRSCGNWRCRIEDGGVWYVWYWLDVRDGEPLDTKHSDCSIACLSLSLVFRIS